MNRRDFLRGLGIATGAAALANTSWLRALDGDPWLREFHAARAEHAWLAGWENFDGEALAERALRWHGKPPRGLAGTLYRNGPARFERAGLRYQHWFDGDGLMQAWRIGAGTVSHRARMVDTPKFRAEQQAGRFLRQAAGTWIPGAEAVRTSDDFNTANTSVIAHDGRLYALWEGGSAWELDADTLVAKGPRVWRDDLESVPFSAHPQRDADGSLWNFGLATFMPTPTLLIWHIGADDGDISVTPLALDMPGFLHSFAMTRRHLIFVIAPWLQDRDSEGSYFERMRWHPERGSEVIVLAKDALDKPIRHQLPAGLAFHYADAWEEDARIVMQACWVDDADAANRSLSGLMRGRMAQFSNEQRDPLVRIELPLSSGGGSARMDRNGPTISEFPTWDSRHSGAGGRVYLAQQSTPALPYFDCVSAWDARRERLDRYRYGDGWLVEEHLFVPRPGSTRRDHGWLLGTALDSQREQVWLSVFDAGHVAAGPICQAVLPHSLPLGFHGHFVPGSAPA